MLALDSVAAKETRKPVAATWNRTKVPGVGKTPWQAQLIAAGRTATDPTTRDNPIRRKTLGNDVTLNIKDRLACYSVFCIRV